MQLKKWALSSSGPWPSIFVRLLVGLVFLSEGIQKFLYPEELGMGRFAHIGIPAPSFFAPFVGAVEVSCGTLLVIGLFTRLAAIPLLINISVALATTKWPLFLSKGFWAAVHEARTDYCMVMGLLYILVTGAGPKSLDAKIFASRE